MVDGQPITDQQSKVFSNQIPLDSIASMEVIAGAPPAEFGEKTSVVINATTRSGQGLTTPTGSVTTSYGSFGTSTVGINLGYGGPKWGNFISASGLNTGRFLDPPEFTGLHIRRLRPTRSVQLLPEWQSLRRPFADPAGVGCSGSNPDKCGPADVAVVCEGRPQHQAGSYVPTDIPERE